MRSSPLSFGRVIRSSTATASGSTGSGGTAAAGGGGPNHILPKTATFEAGGVRVEVPPPTAAPIGASNYVIDVKYAWAVNIDGAVNAALTSPTTVTGSPFDAAAGVPSTLIPYPGDGSKNHICIVYRVRTLTGEAHDRMIHVYEGPVGGPCTLRFCAGLEGRVVKGSASATTYFIWQPTASSNGLAGKTVVSATLLTKLFGSTFEITELDQSWVDAIQNASIAEIGSKSFLVLDEAGATNPIYLVHANSNVPAAAWRFRLEPKVEVCAFTGLGGGDRYTSGGLGLDVSLITNVGLDIPYCETWPGF